MMHQTIDDFVLDHVWGYAEGRDSAIALLRDYLIANIGLRHQSTKSHRLG